MKYRSSAWRVYFVVSSKEGSATLHIDHTAGGQRLTLPVFPSEGVTEALPYLEPAFAHYTAQWQKIMVDDPEETDAKGFYLEAEELPDRIADPENAGRLAEIVNRHLPQEIKDWLVKPAVALSTDWPVEPPLGNVDEVCVTVEEANIDRFVA